MESKADLRRRHAIQPAKALSPQPNRSVAEAAGPRGTRPVPTTGHSCVTIAHATALFPDGRGLLHHREQQAKHHQNTETASNHHKTAPSPRISTEQFTGRRIYF